MTLLIKGGKRPSSSICSNGPSPPWQLLPSVGNDFYMTQFALTVLPPVAALTLHQPIYISQFAFTVLPPTWQLLASVGDGYV